VVGSLVLSKTVSYFESFNETGTIPKGASRSSEPAPQHLRTRRRVYIPLIEVTVSRSLAYCPCRRARQHQL